MSSPTFQILMNPKECGGEAAISYISLAASTTHGVIGHIPVALEIGGATGLCMANDKLDSCLTVAGQEFLLPL